MKNGIIIDNVSFSYPQNSFQLQNINLSLPEGSFCGITGINGSGKTTFGLLLNGLIPHQIKGNLTGNVFVDRINTRSKPVSYFAKSVGIVFQNPDFMLFNLTVEEEIEFGLKNLKLNNYDKRISKALEVVGMKGFQKRDPQTLSLGQKQKLCLACVLAADTKYIVLDEPTAMLDYQSSIKLYELLTSLNRQGKTIIIIEHDTDYLATYANEMIILDKGQIILSGDIKKVFSQTNKLKQIGIKIPQSYN